MQFVILRIIPCHPWIILQKIPPKLRHQNYRDIRKSQERNMQCSRCANSGIVEIKMKIAGEDVMFRQCGRCEAKTWLSIDGPLSLTRVLEMARVAR
jgi:hypothetical protein